jgi:hypothetical protein
MTNGDPHDLTLNVPTYLAISKNTNYKYRLPKTSLATWKDCRPIGLCLRQLFLSDFGIR